MNETVHRGCAVLFCLSAVGLHTPAAAGVLEHFNPVSSKAAGVHLYGIRVSGSYYSNAYGLAAPGVITGPNTGAFRSAQGGLVLGFSRTREQSYVSLVYSPSYVHTFGALKYSSYNHSVAFSAGTPLGRKWTLSASVNGDLNDFDQLLFATNEYGALAATPAGFEDLVTALLTGRSATPALSQALSATQPMVSPESSYMYGARLLTGSASVSVAYAASSRSTFSFFTAGNRSQQFTRGSDAPVVASRYVLPATSSGTAGWQWSYSLSPRTTVSVNASGGRTVSRFQDAWTNQVDLSVGRTMSRNWFLQGSVGAGKITTSRTLLAPTESVQHQYSGALGYRVRSHTLLASYSRSVSDLFGLGANATETAGGAWAWKRPGSSVSVSSSAGYSRLRGPAFPNYGSWVAQASVGKALSSHVALSAGLTYTQYPRTVFVRMPHVSQTGVMLTLSWSPAVRE